MNITFKEILKLKGKKLKNINPNSGDYGKEFTVTRSTKNNIVLDYHIKIKTIIFLETKQENYQII